jgi:Uma2 family endonuclease
MGTATTRLTPEEYLALPEEQTFRTELIDGEVVPMGNALLKHEIIKGTLLKVLAGATGPEWFLMSETMFRVADSEFLQPDVSLISRKRLAEMDPGERAMGAPDIAIEVISSEKATVLQRKITLYLEGGSKEVWVLYPDAEVLFVHRRNGATRLTSDQSLETDALPGFSVPVAAFFEKP